MLKRYTAVSTAAISRAAVHRHTLSRRATEVSCRPFLSSGANLFPIFQPFTIALLCVFRFSESGVHQFVGVKMKYLLSFCSPAGNSHTILIITGLRPKNAIISFKIQKTDKFASSVCFEKYLSDEKASGCIPLFSVVLLFPGIEKYNRKGGFPCITANTAPDHKGREDPFPPLRSADVILFMRPARFSACLRFRPFRLQSAGPRP
jgi:hypothetical protein